MISLPDLSALQKGHAILFRLYGRLHLVRIHRPKAEAVAAKVRISFPVIAKSEFNELLLLVRREGREVIDFLILQRVDARNSCISIVIATVELAVAELLPRLAASIEMLPHPCFVLVAEVCLHRHEIDPLICFVDSIGNVIFVKLRKKLREVLLIFWHGIAIVIDRNFDFRLCEARAKVIRRHDRAIRDRAKGIDAVTILRVEVFDDIRQQLVQKWFATADMEQHDPIDAVEKQVNVTLDLLPRTNIEFLCIGIEVQAGSATQVAGRTG